MKSAWMENIFIQQDLKMPIKGTGWNSCPQSISLPKEDRSLPHINVYLATTGAMSVIIRRLFLSLMKNSGSMGKQWRSDARNPGCPAYIHGCTAERETWDCLRIMNELTNQYGFRLSFASAMEMACARGINICDASVLAARITGYGITTPPKPVHHWKSTTRHS